MVFFIFIQILLAYSGNPDQTRRSLASDQGLHCLPMSHKRALGLYGLRSKTDIRDHEPRSQSESGFVTF